MERLQEFELHPGCHWQTGHGAAPECAAILGLGAASPSPKNLKKLSPYHDFDRVGLIHSHEEEGTQGWVSIAKSYG